MHYPIQIQQSSIAQWFSASTLSQSQGRKKIAGTTASGLVLRVTIPFAAFANVLGAFYIWITATVD